MKDKERIAALEEIIRETIWMARRYADGRSSYATSMFNRARDQCIKLGIEGIKPDKDGEIYADDGMFGKWDPALGRFCGTQRK